MGSNYSGYNAEDGAFDFTYDEEFALRWGAKANGTGKPRVIKAYVKAEKTFYSYNGKLQSDLESVIPKQATAKEKEYAMSRGTAFKEILTKYGVDFKKAIMSKGYDSYASYPGADNIGVYSAEQIKSADPVTYDDNGNVIPLSERFNPEKKDIRHKARYTEYNKPITAEDIATFRSIGRKSINSFTTEDIEKAQKWAYKFYQELGTKSPFFRAWFGDWRAYQDAEAVKVATIPVYVATNEARKENRGLIKNDDTQWDIRISREGETNTISHSGEDRLSEYGLAGIKELLTNAVLLDSEVHEHHKNNAKNDLISFDHKLYALGMDNKGSVALYKITVEEFYQSKNEPGNKKFHNLRYIQKIADNVGGRTSENSRSGGSTNDISAKYSISNLFNLVKQYDKEFKPKAVNPLLLNDDGTPKVLYHGTRSQFTEFILQNKPKFGRALGDGFYFTPNYSKAHQFANGLFSKGEDRGGIVMPVYLRMSNPFVIEETTDRTKWRNEYHKGDYDGIIDLKNQTWYVEDSTQIKSATDNIGTFDYTEKNIRHKSRSYTAGQMAQVKAKLSHNKVYSKKSAMELVSKIAPEIKNRSFEAMSDQLWQELNAYISLDDKRVFAKDKSDMMV